MPCPTCDHTMEGLGYGIFQCRRCGTTKMNDSFFIPALVERCRRFEQSQIETFNSIDDRWRTLGVAESINIPANRRPQ